MTRAPTTYLAYFNRAAAYFRRSLCSVLGHQRSKSAAREIDGIWHSYCERCECPLRRDSPSKWHEISPEDYANASKRASEAWSAMRPRAPRKALEALEPEGRSTKSSGDMRRSPVRGYGVNYFARKHGITTESAREIIDRVGDDRAKLNAAAWEFKRQELRTP